MAIKREERERLQAAGLPSDDEMRTMTQEFLLLSGYTHEDLSEEIGYSRAALNHFIHGRYCEGQNFEGNTLPLREKLKIFIESHSVFEQKMEFGPLFKTGDYARLRKSFYHAVNDGWAYCVDGPPGTRKSYIAKSLIRELMLEEVTKNGSGRRAYFVRARPNIRPMIMLQLMCQAASVPSRGTIDQLMRKLRMHHAQRRAAFIFDEAQHFPTDTLETLRELLDEPPYFGLVFMGSHDIQQRFEELTMAQWHSRIEKTITMAGLKEDEAEQMIQGVMGKKKQATVEFIISKSHEEDYRFPKSDPRRRYLSARKLFNTMREIEALKKERKDKALEEEQKEETA